MYSNNLDILTAMAIMARTLDCPDETKSVIIDQLNVMIDSQMADDIKKFEDGED